MASGARVIQDVATERELVARSDLLVGGVVGGLLAGTAMLAWCVAAGGVARPLELAAAAFFGSDALEGGAAVLVAGGLLWAATSVALALPFAWVVPRDFPFASAAIMGIGYSFFAMAFATSVVLPRVNPLMRAEMPETGGAWVLAYVVFGVGLGLIPRLRRSVLARR